MTPTLRNRIGSTLSLASDGRTMEVRSPSDDSLVGHAPRSSAADVDGAVRAAREAFETWRGVPAPARGEILQRAAAVLDRRKDDIAKCMSREMGKRLEEARGDVQEAIDTAYYAATEGRRLFGRTAPSELANKFGMTVRRPVGIAAIVTAASFPVAVPSWKILPALVCGNAVVWKPAEQASFTADAFAAALEEAGLPAGVLDVVHGLGDEAGAALVAHRDVNLVSFTGSIAVGRQIAAEAGQSSKRLSLELGGKNAVIVMPDADLDLAVEGILWGAFGSAGQRASATSRLIAVGEIAATLVPKLLARVAHLAIGHADDATADIGPIVSRAQRDRIHAFVEAARREGGRVLCGGEIPSTGPLAKGWFYPPTVIDGVARDATIARAETFGPVLAVIDAVSLDDAIDVANDVEYGLSSAIYTRDVNTAFRAIDRIDAGVTYVNAPTIGAESHFPFGGVKATGNGYRDGGWAPYDFFSDVKTVYVDYSGGVQRAQIDNRKPE